VAHASIFARSNALAMGFAPAAASHAAPPGSGELAPASARSFQTSGRFRARAVALDSEAPSGIRPSFPGPNAVTAPNHLCRGFPLVSTQRLRRPPTSGCAPRRRRVPPDRAVPVRRSGRPSCGPQYGSALPRRAPGLGSRGLGKHFLPVSKLVPVIERRHRAARFERSA